jgi:transposase
MRSGWETVGNILARVVAPKLDEARLHGLVFIGVDEVSCGADQNFLTCVADHHKPRFVWAAPGRSPPACRRCSTSSPTSRRRRSRRSRSTCPPDMRMRSAQREASPHAEVCVDPFHVVQLGSKAADQVRRDEYNRHGRSASGGGKWIKGRR